MQDCHVETKDRSANAICAARIMAAWELQQYKRECSKSLSAESPYDRALEQAPEDVLKAKCMCNEMPNEAAWFAALCIAQERMTALRAIRPTESSQRLSRGVSVSNNPLHTGAARTEPVPHTSGHENGAAAPSRLTFSSRTWRSSC